MKILTICPSKYPEKLEKMMDSFLITCSKNTQIIVNYKDKPITKIFNEVFNNNPDYDFYFMANDDLIFTTPLWDLALANKGKISYGNDLLQGQNLCTFPMIDGDIVRALGWLQLPCLEKYSGDQAWMIIGKMLEILEYHPEVKIRHDWKGWDEKLGYEDLKRINEWANNSMKQDIEKVRKILNEKNKT